MLSIIYGDVFKKDFRNYISYVGGDIIAFGNNRLKEA